MQQRCPNCGSPIAPGQRFCGGCGAQLTLACPYCRITVSPGTRFCPSCGATLGGGAPQQAGWGSQPGGMPQQQPGWGQQPGGMPQQPGWGQQPGWSPSAPKSQSSSSRPFLIMLLIVLLIGLGGLVYWQFGDQLLDLFNISNGGNTQTAADTTKPMFSNIKANVGPTSAAITWKTDEPCSTQVEYGKANNYGSLAPAIPDLDPTTGNSLGAVDHAVTLTGLEANTTYHYRVKSKDKAGNEAVSEDKTFTTTAGEESS